MSPAPSTSDADDARKLQDRVRRAKAALEQIGGGEPDPEDLGGPIEVEGAEDILASIAAPPADEDPVVVGSWEHVKALAAEHGLTNGPIRVEGVVPSTSFPEGPPLAVSVETYEEVVMSSKGAVIIPTPEVPGLTVTASSGMRVTGDITWRKGQDSGSEFVAAPDLTPPPPPVVSRETATVETPRTKRKIGIIGYTGSRRLAPYGDPEWELWGLNNLHLAEDIDVTKFDAWFDLHPRTDIVKDEVHRRWLEGGSAGLPCFVWGDSNGEPPADWPKAVAFPQQHILESFPPYFTNSISWMTALAITLLQQRADEAGVGLDECELGVWGVDMATDGEYAAQRPSCEFFIGVAMGLGLQVTIPESSDLLKAASLYGLETSPMLAKIDERIHEINLTIQAMSQAHAQHEAEARQLEANINAGRGAIDQLGYLRGVWFQPTNAGNSTHESPPV